MDAAGERDPVGGAGMIRPYITDHAVVRFCQRGCGLPYETTQDLRAAGVDVDRVRTSLARCVGRGVELGASAVVWGGLRFVLDGSVCLTVMPKHFFWQPGASS